MINLIPPIAELIIRREYLFRATTVFSFLFGLVFLVLAASLIPTYVLITAQINTLSSDAGTQKVNVEDMNKLESEATFAGDIIRRIELATSSPSISELIRVIDGTRTQEVVVNGYNFMEEKGVVSKVVVQGVAGHRGNLIDFKNALSGKTQFKKVEVPLGDLARDKDLPFTLTITLNPQV